MPRDTPPVSPIVPQPATGDGGGQDGQDIVAAVRGGDPAGWCEVLPAAAGRSALIAARVLTEPSDPLDPAEAAERAARLAGHLRMAVRSLIRVDLAPGEALAQLDAVVRDWIEPFSARLLLGIFDPAESVLTLAHAGLPAPVVRDAGGVTPASELPPDAPLGSPDAAPALGASYAESTLLLEPGTSLICWTPAEPVEGEPAAGEAAPLEPVEPGRTRSRWPDWAAAVPAQTADGSPAALADAVSAALGPDAGAVLVVARPTRAEVGPVRVIELDLAEGEDPTRRARAFCYGVLSAWGLTPIVRDDIVLAVSELVANALLYGGAAEQLKLRRWPGRIVVEVFDREPAMPRPRIADADAESGRGLFLVRRVAQRWGARPVPGGKAVWCEFNVPADGSEVADAAAEPISSQLPVTARAGGGAGEPVAGPDRPPVQRQVEAAFG